MLGFTRLVNLRIGTKLAVTSGLAVLLMVGIVVVILMGDSKIRSATDMANRQQAIALDATAAKASTRGMQIGVRDIELAGSPERLKDAVSYFDARKKSADGF